MKKSMIKLSVVVALAMALSAGLSTESKANILPVIESGCFESGYHYTITDFGCGYHMCITRTDGSQCHYYRFE